MSDVPTPAKAEAFLATFFDIDFVRNAKITEEDDDYGKKLATTKLACIIPAENKRKFYHATLYERGIICHYGRLDKNGDPKYSQPYTQKTTSVYEARRLYNEKVRSKMFPKGEYELVEEETF